MTHTAPPAGPPKRKRHIGRWILAGFGALVAIIIATSLSKTTSTTPTVNTKPVSSGTTPAVTTATSAAPVKATVGSAIKINGQTAGDSLTVTLVKVAPVVKATDGFSTPPSGDTYYGAQFRLVDTGTAPFSDAVGNDAVVMDAAGQSYKTDIVGSINLGPMFPDLLNIAPGGTSLGWIVFDVPTGTKISAAQFTLSSGFGNTGQWSIP